MKQQNILSRCMLCFVLNLYHHHQRVMAQGSGGEGGFHLVLIFLCKLSDGAPGTDESSSRSGEASPTHRSLLPLAPSPVPWLLPASATCGLASSPLSASLASLGTSPSFHAKEQVPAVLA